MMIMRAELIIYINLQFLRIMKGTKINEEQCHRHTQHLVSPYRGQALFRRHFLGVFISNLVGLLCLLTVHSVLKVLVFTNHSSVRAAAFKRYLNTMNHVREWYSGDVFHPGSK